MRYISVFVLCAAAALTGFAQAPASKTPAAAPAPAADVPAEPGLYAVFDTSMGAIVVKLFEDKAPNTVKNFTALAEGSKAAMNKAGAVTKHPYYNGLTFHRVIKGFMIQTGDIKGTGSSLCGFPDIKDEIDPSLHFDEPGKLAMANTGRPNSGGCQVFITVGKPTYLDGHYTIFGQVVSGQDVATRISVVPTIPEDKPAIPVVVKKREDREEELMVVTVVAEMLAKPGQEEALKRELLDMVEKTRAEEGCAQYDLHLALDEPGRFVLFENWASEDALKLHNQSAHLKAFGAKAPELTAERRVLRYSRIA